MSHLQSNNQGDPAMDTVVSGSGQTLRAILDICIRYVLPVVALAVAILITLHLLKTGPQARPTPAGPSGVLVETTTVSYDSHPTVIQAMGVVKASRSIELKPQVSGQIIAMSDNLIPGGRFVEGDSLLQLDPSDYRLVLEQQENSVVKAQNDLDLEQGNQLVVKREFDLLNEQVSEEEKLLMLRQPQLSTLQTELSIARAKKKQAELNLDRTVARAPYNGIVQDLNVNVGTWVSTSSVLATLVGSDSYWVEVSVPEAQLQWLNVPADPDEQGSRVRIFNSSAWGENAYRDGQLIRLLPGLETQGRMARLLVEIDDPFSLKSINADKPKVMIDSYVKVEIEGRDIAQAVELPREYLRNGRQVWVFDETGKLTIRDVSIGFKNRDTVLVTDGISGGEKIVTSDISTPVEGLVLRSRGGDPDNPAGRPDAVVAMGRQAGSPIKGAENE